MPKEHLHYDIQKQVTDSLTTHILDYPIKKLVNLKDTVFTQISAVAIIVSVTSGFVNCYPVLSGSEKWHSLELLNSFQGKHNFDEQESTI